MAIVNIAVSKPSGSLVATPTVASSTTGSTVVWTLDAAIAGVFNATKPFEWYTDCGPPVGTCTAATISNAGRTLSMDFLASTDLNLAYKLFVTLSNGKIATTSYGPIGTVPVGAGNARLPPTSPKIKNQ